MYIPFLGANSFLTQFFFFGSEKEGRCATIHYKVHLKVKLFNELWISWVISEIEEKQVLKPTFSS